MTPAEHFAIQQRELKAVDAKIAQLTDLLESSRADRRKLYAAMRPHYEQLSRENFTNGSLTCDSYACAAAYPVGVDICPACGEERIPF
jgi:hypothetical protein